MSKCITKDIVIFMVGGTTYEEAMNVSEFNKVAANSEMNVYFGGSCIHNSVSFLKEIGNTFKSR